MKKIFLTAIVILALSAPLFVAAQGLKDAGKILDKAADTSKTGLSSNLGDTIATVIKTVLALVGTIFLVLTIYAGILWMTAQGEEDKVTKAKDIIKASVIGLVIIMSAYAITAFVTTKLGGATGASNTSNQAETTGCCIGQGFGSATCTENILKSKCNEGGDIFWRIGSCPTGCTLN